MQRELRRQDRKLSSNEAVHVLEKGEYGILAMADKEGMPYGVPLSYVYLDNAIFLHCALEGHKIDNLAVNENVSFCVVGIAETLPESFSMKYESVVVFGKASEIEGEEKYNSLLALVEKYSAPFVEEGKKKIDKDSNRTKVIKITIKKMTGKSRK